MMIVTSRISILLQNPPLEAFKEGRSISLKFPGTCWLLGAYCCYLAQKSQEAPQPPNKQDMSCWWNTKSFDQLYQVLCGRQSHKVSSVSDLWPNVLLFARYFVVFRGQLSVFGGISGLLHLVTDALLWRCNCEATRGQLKATPKVIRGKLCIWQICGLPKLIYNPPHLSALSPASPFDSHLLTQIARSLHLPAELNRCTNAFNIYFSSCLKQKTLLSLFSSQIWQMLTH